MIQMLDPQVWQETNTNQKQISKASTNTIITYRAYHCNHLQQFVKAKLYEDSTTAKAYLQSKAMEYCTDPADKLRH